MLKAIQLTHRFENLLYENLNFEVFSGQSMAILGVSGSGKSTILNNLSTMLKPIEGRVDILEHKDIYSLSNAQLLKIRRYDIGIIFQSHYLFRGFSGMENLKVASIISSNDLDEELLRDLGILEVIYQNIGELSGGQQQRLSIARVLTKKPKIIFADEPTGNLDKETAQSTMKVIFEYIRKTQGVLVLATHDEKIATDCTQMFRLENKRLNRI
ncbi:ABC transporter ATP-binding protein [Helicobacter cappadocius]|uniref:ATP-binding cassette domain-containing protein n=1 Tax=Helicobacter cappadocius TaxID=3063998 RepID=A0AA90PJD7_9HELI|nr:MULTISPECIES: ATP-binding cassette domain-containing protein [unclassified Helicobacter]MDO7252722.1 ATP-binding cassette domain-containing protein [Helicobacter sp. faydin-H75]MDP2538590.1 ATP-binding cassette domain-containing protein [Helicobacter sp. faydin-H76]